VEAFLRLAETGEGIYNVASGVEVNIETLVAGVAEILSVFIADRLPSKSRGCVQISRVSKR
jgi:hypothetical protein